MEVKEIERHYAWHLERNFTYIIRNKFPYNILDRIFCKGVMTDIEMPKNNIIVKHPFVRLLNKFIIVNWWKTCI